jgi:hypothetical protein
MFAGVFRSGARGRPSYLADESFPALKGVKIFNLCRSYRYQGIGYYVSLLAEARGHKPSEHRTIQDMKSQAIIRLPRTSWRRSSAGNWPIR